MEPFVLVEQVHGKYVVESAMELRKLGLMSFLDPYKFVVKLLREK